jgi:hypothetical protein
MMGLAPANERVQQPNKRERQSERELAALGRKAEYHAS